MKEEWGTALADREYLNGKIKYRKKRKVDFGQLNFGYKILLTDNEGINEKFIEKYLS